MIRKLIHFLVHLVFVLFILALVIGVPSVWMIRRSYSDPEVHYFYMEQNIAADETEAEAAAAEEAKAEATAAEGTEPEGTQAEESEPERTQSLRFIVLSDLYGYVFEGGNGIIADLVSNTFPDAILIDGNLINAETEDITQTTDLIKRLSQIAPVYYAYGEQELRYVRKFGGSSDDTAADKDSDPLRAALKKAGAVVLNDEYKDVQLYGISVRIGGMYGKAYELTNPYGDVKRKTEKNYKLLKRFQNTDRFKIMLSNNTEHFLLGDACEKWDIDLVVSGNLLGGLVVLPHYGGVFGGAQGYFPQYIHGVYDKEDTKLLITSGLSAPRGIIPRFNNPPEIAVLDVDGLRRAEK